MSENGAAETHAQIATEGRRLVKEACVTRDRLRSEGERRRPWLIGRQLDRRTRVRSKHRIRARGAKGHGRLCAIDGEVLNAIPGIAARVGVEHDGCPILGAIHQFESAQDVLPFRQRRIDRTTKLQS